MITTVRRGALAGDDLRGMREVLATIIPRLRWRHSGLGILQAYLYEGGPEEARVHVWDNRLRREKIEDAGILHDHRFDMTSVVVLGMLRHREIALEAYEDRRDPFADPYHMVEIRSNYRKSKNAAALVELPGTYTAKFRNVDLAAGDEYDFPRGAFHGTYTPIDVRRWGPTITVVRKTDQRDVNARILAPVGVPVVHAFDAPLPEATWRPILDEAREVLASTLGES